jgi:hypothetical protein
MSKKVFLRQLFVVNLGPTYGTETLYQASDVFHYCDKYLVVWNLDLPGKATAAMSVVGSEIAEDGNYRQIFGSISDDLNTLRLSQAQIKQLAKKHRDKLHPDKDPDNGRTFMLFTREDEPVNEDQSNLFVANVGIVAGLLGVNVEKFSDEFVDEHVKYRHRLVVPQPR